MGTGLRTELSERTTRVGSLCAEAIRLLSERGKGYCILLMKPKEGGTRTPGEYLSRGPSVLLFPLPYTPLGNLIHCHGLKCPLYADNPQIPASRSDPRLPGTSVLILYHSSPCSLCISYPDFLSISLTYRPPGNLHMQFFLAVTLFLQLLA